METTPLSQIRDMKKVISVVFLRAPFFREMFNLRAQGMDDKDNVERLSAMGFRTKEYRKWDKTDRENPRIIGKRGGKPLTVKQLQRYMRQTEYAGVICEKWTHCQPVRPQHFDGLVPVDVFNAANRGKVFIKENPDRSVQILTDYIPFGRIKRLRNNPQFPYKFILCPICRNASWQQFARQARHKVWGVPLRRYAGGAVA
jgi:hypothetical protein